MPRVELEQLRLGGRARVGLHRLYFEPQADDQLNIANVDRLYHIFREDQCRHAEPWTAVRAVIEQDAWDSAIQDAQMSEEDVRPDDNKLPPRLDFPNLPQIRCVTGQHRVTAAKRFLPHKDAWWIVDFYIVDDGKSHGYSSLTNAAEIEEKRVKL